MYAVIATNGKQYKVAEGDKIKIDLLDIEPGKAVDFEEVLLVADGENVQIGTPLLTGMKVTGEVLAHGRHKKVSIIKFRRRKHHLKRQGHRQDYTEVKITKIGK